MDEYIKQLLEIIDKAAKPKADSVCQIEDRENEYINEFADQYINGTPEKISKLTGIEKFQFPPVEKLDIVQTKLLLNSIDKLLLSYNLEFIFPENVTDDIKYGFIIDKWDSEHVHCSKGTVQVETCKFDDDNCPFPKHCSICEDFKEDENNPQNHENIDFDSLMPQFSEEEDIEMRPDIDRFKDLMRNKEVKNYISGIHNYCDGRCNKCDFTNQCTSFTLNQELEKSNDGPDSEKQLMVILKATSEIIEEELSKKGIDPTEKLNELATDCESKPSSKHATEKFAEAYAEKVKHWLESNQREMESRIVIEGNSIEDYVESITWFQLFIPAKINRALHILQVDSPDETETHDANGSAKIALIGIDESIEAWNNLMLAIPKKEDSILNILKHLSKLRSDLEDLLPNARSFIRPGFDDIKE